jgi:amino acid transporter
MFRVIRNFLFGRKLVKDPQGTVQEVAKDVAKGFFTVPLAIVGIIGIIFALLGLGVIGDGSFWWIIAAGICFFGFFFILMSRRVAGKIASHMSGGAYKIITKKNEDL